MIKDEKIDKELQGKGVKFLPFVGDQYWYGISFNDNGELVLGTEAKPGKKVLVLGESHYCDDDWKDEELYTFTRDVLDCYLDSEERYSWMRTFVKFERALDPKESKYSKNIWSHLMFYTYLQKPLYSIRMIGTQGDYEEAVELFNKVLEQYKPDCIMVWGRRLYNNLPTKDIKCFDLSSDIEIMEYNFEGYEVLVMPMQHPSGVFFSCSFWYENVVELFKKYLYGTDKS